MCPCHPTSCSGCAGPVSRRAFLSGCAAAASAGAWGLRPGHIEAGEPGPAPARVRVALVFLANSADPEIWPYPGYDCAARHETVLKALRDGCPQVEFIPMVVRDGSDLPKALALNDSTDGFLIYCTTLTWRLTDAIVQIGRLGKPTLVADEYLGGSGMFLVGHSRMRREGIAAGAVSSTRLDDLAAVARLFAGISRPGTTAQSFAEECASAARRTFGRPGDLRCAEDRVRVADVGECIRRLRQSRFLVVGRTPARAPVDYLGARAIPVGFDEFRALYDQVDRDEAAEWGRRWSTRAAQVVEAVPEWIAKAGGVYLAMVELMKRHGTDSITMNCLGGFRSGQLPAYPCLGFMQILDDGGQGVCEAMPDDSVSMLIGRFLTGRGGYVSDPALDTSRNQVVYSHCMAHTKVFGPDGPASPFRIRTLHNRDPRGCCAESLLPQGCMTTSFRVSVAHRKLVLHQARSAGNLGADRGCRTQLLGDVRGDIEKLLFEWDRFGWHRVTVYGDIKGPLEELAGALKLDVVLEA